MFEGLLLIVMVIFTFLGAWIGSVGVKDGLQNYKIKWQAEAIKHHAARYVNNGQTPDVVFRWNDEVKE